jgi:hypothetical protein
MGYLPNTASMPNQCLCNTKGILLQYRSNTKAMAKSCQSHKYFDDLKALLGDEQDFSTIKQSLTTFSLRRLISMRLSLQMLF